MALQVWLPLDGNLNNLGCGNCKITNNGAIVEDTGKIGKCYSFSGSSNYLVGTPSILNNDTAYWSFACWFKPAVVKTSALFSNRENGNNLGIAVFLMNDNSIVLHNGGRYVIAPTYAVEEWSHIVITINPSKTQAYLNGNLIYSSDIVGIPTQANSSTFLIGAKHANSGIISSGDCFNGLMNDVRIYDHCLSPAEVHEISQGLVQHFKLDGFTNGIKENLLRTIPRQSNPTAYLAYQFNLTENLIEGETYTLQLWDIDISRSDRDINNLGIHIYWGGGKIYIKSFKGTSYFTNGHADYLTATFTITAAQASHSHAVNAWINIYNSTPGPATGVTPVYNMSINKWKLEKGNTGTEYIESYLDKNIGTSIIYDSSGYNHHGTIYGNISFSTNSPRYNLCTFLDGSSAINAGRGGMVTDSITANIWVNYSSGERLLSCFEGGGFGFSQNPVQFNAYVQKGYRSAIATSQSLSNLWYMITGVYDRLNGKVKIYINGELDNENNIEIFGPITYNKTNSLFIGAESTSSSTIPYNFLTGYVSDFRIYCTPLSDDDIAELYHTSAKIDKLGNVHSFELQESDKINIKKNGILKSTQFCELAELTKLKYDTNIYFEPDGSAWVRIFHHNNPTNGLFNETDDFENSVYLDDDRWFNMEICNYLNIWEMMIKSKLTIDTEEKKFRWIQNINPLIATFNDVSVKNVIKITTNEYSNRATWGGLYKKNNKTYLCANNGNSNQWWGAVGAWAFNTNQAIPGWWTTSSNISTGYEDVYIRIDNQQLTNSPMIKMGKNKKFLANKFIER